MATVSVKGLITRHTTTAVSCVECLWSTCAVLQFTQVTQEIRRSDDVWRTYRTGHKQTTHNRLCQTAYCRILIIDL